jgi:hypothetical protein
VLPVPVTLSQFEWLADVRFFCKPGKSAVGNCVGLLVCADEALKNLLYIISRTDLKMSNSTVVGQQHKGTMKM